MDYYILHTVLLLITLLFTNTITCYRYAKHRRTKLKKVLPCRTNNKKCRIMNLKKFLLKIFLLF